jgi:putative PIN family toxin of toxin-antitoxin system
MRASRLVLDTNILISALLSSQGKPSRVVEYALKNGTILFCLDGFDELRTRASRPRFDRFSSPENRARFVRDLEGIVDWVEITGALEICRDPDDNKILETAIVGKADCLVTGDKDLLALRPIGENETLQKLEDSLLEGVYILRASEFLEFLESFDEN